MRRVWRQRTLLQDVRSMEGLDLCSGETDDDMHEL